MFDTPFSLPQLGWSHFFQQQLSLEEWESTSPVRITAVHRNSIDVAGKQGYWQAPMPGSWFTKDSEERPTVGDWLLLDSLTKQPLKILERKSLIRRRAAGIEAKVQLIAANIDTLFIVTSCNQDFNLSRLERYLLLALEAKVEPVLILTKADLHNDLTGYFEKARSIDPTLAIEAVNALDSHSTAPLFSWCDMAQTVALVGSSGVGKSTLINTLCGTAIQQTATIREDDAKGRHTTTSRSLHFIPNGGLLIDTPGLRELQLSACPNGMTSLYEDIEVLAQSCRFKNCHHTMNEVGCAVTAAVTSGDLSIRRLTNYLKILAEQERNAETIAERRRRDKNFSKLCRNVKTTHKKIKGDFF